MAAASGTARRVGSTARDRAAGRGAQDALSGCQARACASARGRSAGRRRRRSAPRPRRRRRPGSCAARNSAEPGRPLRIPGDVLAGEAHAGVACRNAPAWRVVLEQDRHLLAPAPGRAARAPVRRNCATCAQEPGPAIAAAADHHPVGAGLRAAPRPRRSSVRMSPLTITGIADRLLHLADEGPIGGARVELQRVRPCTVTMRMPHSSAMRARRGALQAVMVPAHAHLQRHRHRHRLDRRFEDARGGDLVAHQRGAGAWPTATFFTGQPKLMSMMAAPRSSVSRAASAMTVRLAAGELHRHRSSSAVDLGHLQGLAVLPHHRLAGDHLARPPARAPCAWPAGGTAGR